MRFIYCEVSPQLIYLQKKIRKYLHFISCTLSQKIQLKNLNKHSERGTLFVHAFLEVKQNSFTTDEKKQFEILEQFREKLSFSEELISFEEIGVDKKIAVQDVVKKAASPIQWSKLFFSLTKWSRASHILEIGTNLGISGQYFVEAIKANPSAKFTTMEGVKRMCEIAEVQLSTRSINNKLQILHGLYADSLEHIKESKEEFDLVFIDGNHTYDATVYYFNLLKPQYTSNAILIIDDINWSIEMQQAWIVLKNDPLVSFSIDLFKLGILFLGAKNKKNRAHQLFLHF